MTVRQPSDEIIDRVAELLQKQVGLRPESTLRGRLRRCIRDEAMLAGQELEGYVQTLALDSSAGGSRLQSLLNRVTVQETGFFRHPEHFEALARDIFPSLQQPVKIWSAGCANGQEAFSLAMLLDEHGIEGSVIATDVSTSALQRTSTARYTAREVTGLSPHRISRHLAPVGQTDGEMVAQTWEVNRSLRNRVTSQHHNLIDPVPDQARACQVVFCRNVLIYFSSQHARTFLDRVVHALPAAWLFLGSAETIWSLGGRYETVQIGKTYAYRPLRDNGRTQAQSTAALPAPVGEVALPAHPGGPARSTSAATASDSTAVADFARAGQQALARGDAQAAVVMFRKWVYLAHDDALAHLHLALALEAGGDVLSARRAFAAARRVLDQAHPSGVEPTIDGYAAAELTKLLDAKQQGRGG